MQTLELANWAVPLREALQAANGEPLVITEDGLPKYVVRSLVDDDLADELISLHPEFLASIQAARQHKAEGKVKTLAEVKAKYAKSSE